MPVGFVEEVYGGFHLVDVLAPSTPRAGGADLEILRIELNFHCIGFRHHRHSGGGGVDSPLGFRGRDALHPMDPRFKFQLAVDAVAAHRKN